MKLAYCHVWTLSVCFMCCIHHTSSMQLWCYHISYALLICFLCHICHTSYTWPPYHQICTLSICFMCDIYHTSSMQLTSYNSYTLNICLLCHVYHPSYTRPPCCHICTLTCRCALHQWIYRDPFMLCGIFCTTYALSSTVCGVYSIWIDDCLHIYLSDPNEHFMCHVCCLFYT